MSTDQKTTKTKTNTQIVTQFQNVPQTNFHDQPRSSHEQDGNYPFFQQRKSKANKNHAKN